MSQLEYYMVDYKNHLPYNIKSNDLYTVYFKNDPKFTYLRYNTIEQVKEFVMSKKNMKNVVIIFYMYTNYEDITMGLMDFLLSDNLDNILAKILLVTTDYWYHMVEKIDNTQRKIFNLKNHYIVTFADSLDNLELFHNKNYEEYSNRIIFNNIWTSYNSSFIEFNQNPENKIAVSGTISRHYPERVLMSNLKNNNIIVLPNLSFKDEYQKRLNKYICCFASSVHVPNLKDKRLTNTHLITLKYFEILASGTLLLCPDSESKQLNRLGIYHNVNCIMINISDINNIIKTVDYVIDSANREEIDNMRKSGQELARTKLNSEKKYEELMDIFETLFKE